MPLCLYGAGFHFEVLFPLPKGIMRLIFRRGNMWLHLVAAELQKRGVEAPRTAMREG